MITHGEISEALRVHESMGGNVEAYESILN